jgi:hypothetical protein
MQKSIFSKTVFLLILLLTGSHSLKAQWTEVGTFNQFIADLKSFSGQLWVGGNFTKVNGESSYWSAAYEAGSFSLQPNLIGGVGINRFEVFNNELFATGGLDIGGVFSWNGFTWEGEGAGFNSFTGLYADGNDLYAGSDFGAVLKKTGSGSFIALPSLGGTAKVNAFAKFNGQIVAAGQFHDVGGTIFNNIAAWTGSGWVPLGSGLNGPVRSLAVYNNELYAAGNFSQAGGQPANYIAKWNGSAWSSVGGSVTVPGFNGIRDMVVADNRLYVAGQFSKIGNVTTKDVALSVHSALPPASSIASTAR